MSHPSAVVTRAPSDTFNLSSAIVASTYRFEWFYLLLTMGILVLFDIYKAVANPFNFDEFMTLFIGRLPSYSEMLRAMPVDGQPPLNYIVTHFAIVCFGISELSIRLPELLAYSAAGLLTYKITRSHGSPAQSLFAMTIVMHAPIARQAFTARPYGLLLAFTALAFLSWQHAASANGKRLLPLSGVAVGLGGAILSHQFGIIQVGLFLLVGESIRFIRNRRIDRQMLVAILAGCLPLIITVPLALKVRAAFLADVLKYPHAPGKPHLSTMLLFLQEANIVLLISPVLIAVPFLLLRSRHSELDQDPVPVSEWGAIATLCLLFPIVLAICVFAGQFAARYAIGSSLGIAVLTSWLAPKLWGLQKRADIPVLLTLAWFLAVVSSRLWGAQRFQPLWLAHPEKVALNPLIRSIPDDNLMIVVESAADYPQEWWYASDSVRRRLIYLYDKDYAVYQPEFLGEYSLTSDREIVPMPLAPYQNFLEQHQHFFLLSTWQKRYLWTAGRLSHEGWHLTTLARSGEDALYRVDRQ